METVLVIIGTLMDTASAHLSHLIMLNCHNGDNIMHRTFQILDVIHMKQY